MATPCNIWSHVRGQPGTPGQTLCEGAVQFDPQPGVAHALPFHSATCRCSPDQPEASPVARSWHRFAGKRCLARCAFGVRAERSVVHRDQPAAGRCRHQQPAGVLAAACRLLAASSGGLPSASPQRLRAPTDDLLRTGSCVLPPTAAGIRPSGLFEAGPRALEGSGRRRLSRPVGTSSRAGRLNVAPLEETHPVAGRPRPAPRAHMGLNRLA